MIQQLNTARLSLRDVLAVDVAAYHKNFVDYEVIRELAAVVPWPYPADGVAGFLAEVRKGQGFQRWVWAIYLQAGLAEPIGNIDLRRSGEVENRGSGWRENTGATAT